MPLRAAFKSDLKDLMWPAKVVKTTSDPGGALKNSPRSLLATIIKLINLHKMRVDTKLKGQIMSLFRSTLLCDDGGAHERCAAAAIRCGSPRAADDVRANENEGA